MKYICARFMSLIVLNLFLLVPVIHGMGAEALSAGMPMETEFAPGDKPVNYVHFSDLRTYLGIDQLSGLTGEDVVVFVVDEFKDLSQNEASSLSHGNDVVYTLLQIAPKALIRSVNINLPLDQIALEILKILDNGKRVIINLSFKYITWSDIDDATYKKDREIFLRLAQKGAFLVTSAGNEGGVLLGSSRSGQRFADLAREINEDPTISGALLFAGGEDIMVSREDLPNMGNAFLSSYSTLAGAARDSYLCVPFTALLIPKVQLSNSETSSYGIARGTSYAAPILAGGAALLWSKDVLAKDLYHLLINTADKITGIADPVKNSIMDKNGLSWTEDIQLRPKDISGQGRLNLTRAQKNVKEPKFFSPPSKPTLEEDAAIDDWIKTTLIPSDFYEYHSRPKLSNKDPLMHYISAFLSDISDFSYDGGDLFHRAFSSYLHENENSLCPTVFLRFKILQAFAREFAYQERPSVDFKPLLLGAFQSVLYDYTVYELTQDRKEPISLAVYLMERMDDLILGTLREILTGIYSSKSENLSQNIKNKLIMCLELRARHIVIELIDEAKRTLGNYPGDLRISLTTPENAGRTELPPEGFQDYLSPNVYQAVMFSLGERVANFIDDLEAFMPGDS